MDVSAPDSKLETSVRANATIGMHPDDVLSVRLALSGLSYPAERWQLLDHATRTDFSADVAHGPVRRTLDQLWTLPNRRYHHVDDVLTALARTRRGHPRRQAN